MKARTIRSTVETYSWEATLFVLFLLSIVTASILSPMYLNLFQILYSFHQSMVITGVLAIGFMMVILVSEIDISIPAILAIGTVTFARLSLAGVPFWLALIIVLTMTTTAGLINGLLIVTFSLPSMAVTLGMMGIYRAIALQIGGVKGFSSSTFSDQYLWLGSTYLFGSVPVAFLFLIALFILFGIIVHSSAYGRLLYATGNSRKAVYFSGYKVKRIVVSTYAIAGFLAGIGALLFIGQYESARSDNASSILLFVVACVCLGGFSLSGGKGNVIGLVLSLAFLGTIMNGMGLANIPGPVQTLVIGVILIVTILIPAVGRKLVKINSK